MADIDVYFLFSAVDFNDCIIIGVIFFLIVAVIEYHPAIRDKLFLAMKVPITIVQAVVIYFIAALVKSITPAGREGM
ncbi:MAG: hypothetical protein M8353_05250 [ANME-2 cluster archaeon]|nr:hypothetical protein [ANME-2 cluster archaeon]